MKLQQKKKNMLLVSPAEWK